MPGGIVAAGDARRNTRLSLTLRSDQACGIPAEPIAAAALPAGIGEAEMEASARPDLAP